MLTTREQERAKYALEKVRFVKKNKDKEYRQLYKSLVKGFSTMIYNNGLGQALAFLKAKNEDHHKNLYNHISSWFSQDATNEASLQDNDLLLTLINVSSQDYRYFTQETIALLNWFRKFVDSELSVDEE